MRFASQQEHGPRDKRMWMGWSRKEPGTDRHVPDDSVHVDILYNRRELR